MSKKTPAVGDKVRVTKSVYKTACPVGTEGKIHRISTDPNDIEGRYSIALKSGGIGWCEEVTVLD